ncbi:hypothetical protein [Methylovirgula sp. HY1]|uniref:hypothetical protein n=1 Tax=Methylovirgula sp. HY1 TaxID=2822761 RepID=UPI001C5AB8A6|nr:hypothetical protein [Methylovirgula sp. HY1]QXX76000.1 hypothetical protein MHY1_02834 [Methylovirgula sp. HY1]
MSLQLISKHFVDTDIRQRPLPITSPAQIIRAVLAGLLLAFLVFWVLPQSRLLLASQSGGIGLIRMHGLG